MKTDKVRAARLRVEAKNLRSAANKIQEAAAILEDQAAALESGVEQAKPKQAKLAPEALAPPEAWNLANQIADHAHVNGPTREKKVRKWVGDIDILHRIHAHPWNEIAMVFDFARRDAFWYQYILSGLSFRKNYEKILSKAMAKREPQKPTQELQQDWTKP